MVLTIDTSLLTGFYQSRLGLGASAAAPRSPKVAPTAPWTKPPTPAEASASVKTALTGKRLINENAAQLDLAGASADYRKLFALYQGLTTLSGVAEQMRNKGLTSFDTSRIQATFAKGMAEVTGYVDTLKLEKLRVAQGEAAASVKTTVPVAKTKTDYVTPPLVSGSSTDLVPAFQGNVNFTISIKRVSTIHNVQIDLAGMGVQPRSMANVVTYINDQLTAAGVDTRVATQRTAGLPRTVEAGGKTVTLGPGPDQWALKVKVSIGETVTFAAPATAGAVYMAQTVGNPDPDGKPATNDDATQRQMLKFQTDTATVEAPAQKAGEANWVEGRAFVQALGPQVKAVHDTKVGADGSVYMLADVTAKIEGQGLRGKQDVALLKYDPAGKLIYARTLGAGDNATGLALALSADGKIAVAGAVTGALNGAVEGPLNSGATGSFATQSDSFVTLYDAEGQEVWTQRRGARQADEASEVAFGADGTVYVQGRAQSGMPGSTAVGGWDSYVQAFKVDATGKVQTLFTHSFGTTGSDRPAGLVVDGSSLVTASVDDGRAVLRRFDLSGGTPVLSATRDLGDLQGGEITGLALDGGEIVVAGSTRNAALAAGTVTRAHAGGSDAFAARLSAGLTASAGDRLAYYGGTGDDRATSLAVSGGQVWIAGQAGTDLPGQPAVGTKDGFLTRLDVAAGTIDWSRRFTGKDGRAAPTSIAIDPVGASVLDRIGLPKGTLDLSDSARITAVSSARAGDQFTIKAGEGRAQTVTITENDTLDTLAHKIRRAAGFQAKVTLSIVEGVRRLSIAPLNDRMILEIGPGKTDKNALAMLGIPEGVVRNTDVVDGKSVPADGKGMLYGLGLPSDLNLATDQELAHSLSQLAQAMGVIRTAYKDLVAAATPKSAQAATTAAAAGKVPAYLSNQIANYQAALNRLTGG
ncbi:hypothetical protein [Phenylobacterium sp.]|uniref:hypothetical protein n=1 Tax=Phenylobacterium sp. TaxID=1871053 RepID=UPI0039832150